MFFRTERLFLRPGWPEDLDDLLEAFNDEAIQRTIEVSAFPRTREAVRTSSQPVGLRAGGWGGRDVG